MAKSHRITVVVFPPSQSRQEVKVPFCKAVLYTGYNEDGFPESVHDRIGRFQNDTQGVLFQITEIVEVGEPVLDGTGVASYAQAEPASYHQSQGAGANQEAA